MNRLYLSQPFTACYENNLAAFIPQLWAQEGLQMLEGNLVMASMVHRDFEDTVAKFGDVVNTRRPGEFKIRRKKDGTNLVQQDAVATNVQVPLDQWFYSSFVIRDGEGSKSFQELSTIYLQPAMKTIAEGVDRALLGRVHAYLGGPANRVGKLGGLSASTAKDYRAGSQRAVEHQQGPHSRAASWSWPPRARRPCSKPTCSSRPTSAAMAATPWRTPPSAASSASTPTWTRTSTASCRAARPTAIRSRSRMPQATTGAHGVRPGPGGRRVRGGGRQRPADLGDGYGRRQLRPERGSQVRHEDNAVATRYVKCVTAAAYSAGYSEGIALTVTEGKAPQVGQLLAFGTTAGTRHTYTVIESEGTGTSCTVYLDRPLVADVGSGASAFPGPYGAMNLAFHRDALALVTRPLALPDTAGVMVGHADYNGITMRVLAQYDIGAGGLIVNCDILAGVAVLNSGLLVPVLG